MHAYIQTFRGRIETWIEDPAINLQQYGRSKYLSAYHQYDRHDVGFNHPNIGHRPSSENTHLLEASYFLNNHLRCSQIDGTRASGMSWHVKDWVKTPMWCEPVVRDGFDVAVAGLASLLELRFVRISFGAGADWARICCCSFTKTRFKKLGNEPIHGRISIGKYIWIKIAVKPVFQFKDRNLPKEFWLRSSDVGNNLPWWMALYDRKEDAKNWYFLVPKCVQSTKCEPRWIPMKF